MCTPSVYHMGISRHNYMAGTTGTVLCVHSLMVGVGGRNPAIRSAPVFYSYRTCITVHCHMIVVVCHTVPV